MRRSILLFSLMLLTLLSATPAKAREAWHDWCQIGNQHVITSGLSSTTVVQKSAPSCVVTVYVHGGGLATIYADNNGTVLANPFTSQSDGQIIWYADNGVYDQTTSNAGLPQTVTLSGILLCDPFVMGSTCNNGGATQAHNLLSTTHLDTIPASPPVRGDVITAQNQTSPTGVNPSWARLPLGSNNFVLTSNGVDAIWAPVATGAGCTLPGVTDTAVVSEHPVTVCYDSANWTWNDAINKQNMQAGVTNSAGFKDSFIFGTSNIGTGLTTGLMVGDTNNVVSTDANVFVVGINNGGGQALNINDCFVIGENNRFPGLGNPSTHGLSTDDCGIFGEGNSLNFTNVGATGGNPDDIWIVGSNNTITETSSQAVAVTSVHILGRQNTISDALNEIDFVTIAGDRNTVNGAATTAQILGWNNSLSNVSLGINTSVVGADNTLTHVATTTYASMIGDHNTLSNCDACYIFGENVSSSVNNTIAIGMSPVAGLTITNSGGSNDNVQRTPLAFASLPSCAAGTEGSFAAVNNSTTAVAGATITGGGTNHVLGYCNAVNWIVAGGTGQGNHGLSFSIGIPGGTALTAASTTTDYITVPFACTISAYNLAIDAGTITVKFWKVATGTAIPTSGNSINTSGVGISSGTAIHSTTLSDFTTTSVAANDIMAMNVTAVATAAFVNGVLQCNQ